MARVIRQNFFNTIWGSIKFAVFLMAIVVQLPIVLLVPRGRMATAYMRVFMVILIFIAGIRVRRHGRLTSARPLLVVCNHISVFELATFPVAFCGSFFGKKDIEHWPLVGWVAKKFNVIFVDRRPAHARDALQAVQQQMARATYPMVLFPEGTTTNGAYVKAFKSTLFNVVENADVTVQPVVIHYRHRDGTPISNDNLAQHYAYFDNAKQDMGPRALQERSLVAQVFHIMVIGGFMVEFTALPPASVGGMDRKEIAQHLHDDISKTYIELQDKRSTK
ncbi:1-acyl-sn-glycerol-3-phosphate acyltransferase [bacterium]|nr:1-acyl-sn-glycerol-3-phosphate acyltransferase [bacterium]